ncbi:hypothetical protein GQ457_01G015430 [Hibiscus cannabinus]
MVYVRKHEVIACNVRLGTASTNFLTRYIYRSIPRIYNLVMTMLWYHPINNDTKEDKVVHYCAAGDTHLGTLRTRFYWR